MSTIVKKLLSKSIQNLIVIALAFCVYLLSLYFALPVIIQLIIIATVLLSFLRVEDNHTTVS